MSSVSITERQLGWGGAIMVALGPLSVAIFTPAIPTIVAEFEASEAAGKFTISIFYVGLALGQLVCGLLADGLGRRSVALGFFGLYLIGSMGCLLAPGMEWLIGFRAVQGAGAAAGLVISRALVRDLFTGQASSRILNLMAIIIAAGPAFAPALGSVLLLFGGTQLPFVTMVVHGVVALVIAATLIPETVKIDLSRIRPFAMVQSMSILVRSKEFMWPALCTAGCAGAIYGQASILPFLLISEIGVSPQVFGVGMFCSPAFICWLRYGPAS